MPGRTSGYRRLQGSGDAVLGDGIVGLVAEDTPKARTIFLPDATRCCGKVLVFKDEDAAVSGRSTGRVQLQPPAMQTIDGEDFLLMTTKRGVCEIYSDGANWQVLRNGAP